MEEQKSPNMFLLQPLSVLVIILVHNAAVHTAKSQDDRLIFSRSYNPVLREQAIMMMSKRGVGPYYIRWSSLKKKYPHPPALLPTIWCLTTFSKTIARARRHVCPEPGRIDEPRKYPASFGISYGRG